MMTTRMPATEDAAGGAPLVEPAIRQEFADTALWVGALETAADGTAEVELTMPENLTAWKVNVWGMGRGTRVGQGSAEVVTRKNIVVRLQAPHFFVERDEVVLSAIVHNYLDAEKSVLVRLDLQGPSLELPTTLPVDAGDGQTTEAPQMQEIGVSIPPGGETRVNWRVRVVREGQAVVRMSARTDVESDAMQMTFPVLVRGALTTASFSGAIRPGDSTGGFTLTVPEDRRPDQTRLELRYSPTLAGAMGDALPYLADYPYGCTEQTLNRFLPAVLTQRTLQQMGVDLKSIQEKRTNLNAQELGDNADRARQWRRLDRNPVFDEATLNDMVKAGVNRLSDMQLADGGWGWFSGWGERSSAHTTAVVVRGLALARANDVAIVPGVIERGIEWLRRYQAEQLAALDNWDREAAKSRDPDSRSKPTADNLDALVYLVLAESQRSASGDFPTEAELPADAGRRMRDYLYGDRTKLAPYSLATLALALHLELPAEAKPDDPRRDMLAMLLRNLSQYLQQDDENQTAWLDLPGGQWWHWYGSEFEAQAYYLKLLAAIEPDSPVAPRLVKYLLNNRKHAGVWNSTRDTALVVEALAAFLAASGEARPNMSLEILVDGELAKTVEITPETLFSFDNSLVLVGDQLAAGDHVVELRKTGDGPVYFNGYLTNFSLQDPIPAAGLELKVARRYYKLTPAADRDVLVPGSRGQALSQRGQKYDRTPVADLATLTSGDLVEVELIVDSK
ncbi:MAG TPA: alpha-2-macroglobulin family protein, partial [Lacipirellulaceae bacterium]|nr:alpha-2-macroglobulin family protein [Lacipirellulaceae bacterium]